MGLRHAELSAADISMEANPYVGRMANRLVRSFSNDGAVKDTDRWALIAEVLGFAAEAEQKLSEQQLRISHLESLAMTDDLTGVGNRRALDDFLRRALANAGRHGETGVIGFLDLDHFKSINDIFGHETGDQAIRKVAQVLVSNTRVSDFVARIGGDEFVVVLTHCKERDGRKRMKQIRALVDSSTLMIDDTEVRLAASLGTVAYKVGCDATDLLQTADALMYSDKIERKLAAVNPLACTAE